MSTVLDTETFKSSVWSENPLRNIEAKLTRQPRPMSSCQGLKEYLTWLSCVKVEGLELRGNLGNVPLEPTKILRSPFLLKKLVIAREGRTAITYPATVQYGSLPQIKEMLRVFTNITTLHIILPPHAN
jgi:hypothetical protein